jgi:hypothetical protein
MRRKKRLVPGGVSSFDRDRGTFFSPSPMTIEPEQLPKRQPSLNASGQIVGSYDDLVGGHGGFLATPVP